MKSRRQIANVKPVEKACHAKNKVETVGGTDKASGKMKHSHMLNEAENLSH
jgi:hypothetical protein